MVRIITDSAADFEHSESEKFGISTIPLAVYIDGKEGTTGLEKNIRMIFYIQRNAFTGLQSCRRLCRKPLNPRRMSTNVL